MREADEHVPGFDDGPNELWRRIEAALKPADGGGDACAHSEGNKRGCPECGETFKP